MEQITLGQIASAVALIAGLITGGTVLAKKLKEWLTGLLTEKFNGVDLRLDDVQNQLIENRKANLRAFLIQEMRALERGEKFDAVEMSYFKDEYDVYRNEYHENSYIHDKFESLKERGLL